MAGSSTQLPALRFACYSNMRMGQKAAVVIIAAAITCRAEIDWSIDTRQLCLEDSIGIPPSQGSAEAFGVFANVVSMSDYKVKLAVRVARLSWRNVYGATENPSVNLEPVVVFAQEGNHCCRVTVNFPYDLEEKPYVESGRSCCDEGECGRLDKLRSVRPRRFGRTVAITVGKN